MILIAHIFLEKIQKIRKNLRNFSGLCENAALFCLSFLYNRAAKLIFMRQSRMYRSSCGTATTKIYPHEFNLVNSRFENSESNYQLGILREALLMGKVSLCMAYLQNKRDNDENYNTGMEFSRNFREKQ
jgi:hypothetical protein